GSQETDSTHTGGSTTIEIGPVAIALGRPSSIQTRASFSLLGYEASVRGEAGLKRLLEVARAFGIPAPAVSGDGISNVDLVASRAWWEGGPLVTGTAQIHNVRVQVRGLNSPLDIRSADLVVSRDSVRVRNITGIAAGSQWHGSMVVPRPCPTPRDCTLQFNLH